MPIAKGQPWGKPAPLPDDGVVVGSDAEARRIVEAAWREGRPRPVLGLVGGDLCRTLGGSGDAARLRSPDAVTMTIDLGVVTVKDERRLFVAHAVARTPGWARAAVAMNGQWLGGWNLAPRAHPGDGRLDLYEARLGVGDRMKVRARLPSGAHLPHPAIHERRVRSADLEFGRSRAIVLDGERVAVAHRMRVELEPDALQVVVA